MDATVQAREQEILNRSVALLVQECHPRRIYLFGSRAKGEAQPTSDFDLAVDGPTPDARRRSALQAQLDAIAGLYSLNLVFLDDVSAPFRAIVLDSGKILYEHA